MNAGSYPLVQLAWGVVLYWLVLGCSALLLQRRPRLITNLVFPLGALGALFIAGIGVAGLALPASTLVLPIGLPDLPFHLRLDALSAFFLVLLGGAAFGVTLYAVGYLRDMEAGPLALLALWYHLFLLGMSMVLLADDAYAFMVSWEVMALSSYFLVTTDHKIPDIRRAGFLYLLIAHVGAVALLLCFGVLDGGRGDYTFDTIRLAQMAPFWASVAFLLALFGFGAKAGLVPMHVWLPEAHPAAPSPVSALMSGVMLKTAIYGLLRITFDLLNVQLTWWGTLVLALGLITALYGVIFAAVQSDMKRLLAWSSIENIGLILAAFGLTLVFYTNGERALAAVSLTALLYHSINHAFFKGLLFLGTGSVLHATGQRNMACLGGLMRFMPWTAWLVLIGALAIAGPTAAQRLRLRVAPVAGIFAQPGPEPALPAHGHPGGRRRRRPGGGTGGLCHGQVFWGHLPRATARPQLPPRPRSQLATARRDALVGLWVHPARAPADSGHRLATTCGETHDRSGPAQQRQLAAPDPGIGGAGQLCTSDLPGGRGGGAPAHLPVG